MKDNKTFREDLVEAINAAFEEAFSQKNERLEDVGPTSHKPLYESIEDYTKKTGKRFRLTKEEKAEGLSREQAFNNRYYN
jgi:hypothetical protein